jgi:hypothetical protein
MISFICRLRSCTPSISSRYVVAASSIRPESSRTELRRCIVRVDIRDMLLCLNDIAYSEKSLVPKIDNNLKMRNRQFVI